MSGLIARLRPGGSGRGLSYWSKWLNDPCKRRIDLYEQWESETTARQQSGGVGMRIGLLFHSYLEVWLNQNGPIDLEQVRFDPEDHPALVTPEGADLPKSRAQIPLVEARSAFNWFQSKFKQRLFGKLVATEFPTKFAERMGWGLEDCLASGVTEDGAIDFATIHDPNSDEGISLGLTFSTLRDMPAGLTIYDAKVVSEFDLSRYSTANQATNYFTQLTELHKASRIHEGIKDCPEWLYVHAPVNFVYLIIIRDSKRNNDHFEATAIRVPDPTHWIPRKRLSTFLKLAYRMREAHRDEPNSEACHPYGTFGPQPVCPFHWESASKKKGTCNGF